MLKQLDELGAKVVWQREGEAGLQFLLAPDEVAARIQQGLPAAAAADETAKPAAPAPEKPVMAKAAMAAAPEASQPPVRSATRRLRQRLLAFMALGLAAAALVIGGGRMLTDWRHAGPPPALALTAGASDQRSCSSLMGRVNGSSNQVDFSLNVASAAQAKCLDVHHLGPTDSDPREGMVRAAKRPIQ
jgi:hypothetical protein